MVSARSNSISSFHSDVTLEAISPSCRASDAWREKLTLEGHADASPGHDIQTRHSI